MLGEKMYPSSFGSEINVLPITFGKLVESLTKRLKPTRVRLTGYGSYEVPNTGTCHIECKPRDKMHSLEFFIADTTSTPIIGFDSYSAMGLVKIEDHVLMMTWAEVAAVKTDNALENTPKNITEKYSEIFHGIGQVPRMYTMRIKPEVFPMIHAHRRVLFALRDHLKAELDKEESLGIIVKADELTEWVNSIMIVEKKNRSLQICLDPRDLNKALRREHYSCPTIEVIAARLHGAKMFTMLDATSGYWQVKLKCLLRDTCEGRADYLRKQRR